MDNLTLIENKILTLDKLFPLLSIWKFQDKKTVFTNGCFDLLHRGHVDYLAKASDLGHKLIIGLNSDSSTSSIKGPHRPITDQTSRAQLLASFFFVDAVVLFNEETPYELIKAIKPDVLVKGADYTIDKIVGADLVTANGGEVKTIDYIAGYSTSAIEQKIRNSV
ncbi:D-glycero-beta-D-manno-heptose 1-phosphate adenylyltransferase [Paradesertivirga mongoliensis]|uniref:D-glycero-beta-D-manno-heptose 1-phosphate adenylyltransferase n=1 Tax=Paradesertivirga mongoliensis TaxID=2100740 RepID=A0ABW4ZHB1_9SPHI|nr:D-glycero-beta-D-manno-heptose 1-phosphate adenylyltransferase [Pedobacter mongoliensis]